MAKARAIEGLRADGAYAAAAARIIDVRATELIENAQGVLDLGDIERLHDMRVATRRLRAALEIFEPCFPKREWRSALREVKALADALGERRDRDVTIDSLERISAAMPAADRPGITTLIEDMRLEQAEANKALSPFVSASRIAALGVLLSELVGSAGGPNVRDPADGNVIELNRRESAGGIPRSGVQEEPSRRNA
jgi:CHAD domain-containing protein